MIAYSAVNVYNNKMAFKTDKEQAEVVKWRL